MAHLEASPTPLRVPGLCGEERQSGAPHSDVRVKEAFQENQL